MQSAKLGRNTLQTNSKLLLGKLWRMFVFPDACDFQQKVNFLEIKDQLCRRVVLDERARKLFDKVAEATSNSNRRRHSPAEKLKSFDNQTTQNNNNTTTTTTTQTATNCERIAVVWIQHSIRKKSWDAFARGGWWKFPVMWKCKLTSPPRKKVKNSTIASEADGRGMDKRGSFFYVKYFKESRRL